MLSALHRREKAVVHIFIHKIVMIVLPILTIGRLLLRLDENYV